MILLLAMMMIKMYPVVKGQGHDQVHQVLAHSPHAAQVQVHLQHLGRGQGRTTENELDTHGLGPGNG